MSETQRRNVDISSVSMPIKSVDEDLSVEERLTENATKNILPARYLLRDENGEIEESPAELFERVANYVARAELKHGGKEDYEKWRKEFENLMKTLQFMPNSPTLFNAGTEIPQLSACFVRSPDDTMDDIFQTAKDAAKIFKTGGGMGYSLSNLRPKGALIRTTGGESSGPVSFLEVYDTTCDTVEQGGKRRGAQMAIMRADHPDIGRFVVAKRKEGRFDNFNISVGVTEEFESAVRNDEMYTLYDPETDYEEPFEVVKATEHFYNPEYSGNPADWSEGSGELVDENLWRDYSSGLRAYDWERGETVSFTRKWATDERVHLEEGDKMELPARFIWDLVVDGAWQNGEPGLFYLDETNDEHTFDVEKHPKYRIQTTNPCSEQPLCQYEACNLGHVNLSLMMEEDAPTFKEWEGNIETYILCAMDMEQLQRVVRSGTRFLDNVVTMSDFPLEEIERRVANLRKIGLGIMGFAQLLAQMGIRYGSDESYRVAEEVMKIIDWTATQESHSLAKSRGKFNLWHISKYRKPQGHPDWFERHTYEKPEDWEDGFPIRNHNVTTIAPTGTTSMIANTTGGCEPMYNVANFKNVGSDIQGDDMLVEFDDYFLQTLEENGIDVEEVKSVAEEKMRNNEFDGPHDLPIPETVADVFVTTQQITPEEHTKMQRAFQKHVDSGISKTLNAPNSATRADVHETFMLALEDRDNAIGAPAKGITFYRDGSRNEQVLTTRTENKLDDACPECEDGELIQSEGCSRCVECGYSPCA